MQQKSVGRLTKLVLVLAAVASFACSSRRAPPGRTSGGTAEPRGRTSATLQAEAPEILYSGDSTHVLYRSPGTRLSAPSGFFDAARIVVRDSSTWRAVWARLVSPDARRPPPPHVEPPAVDFTREIVIVVAQGPAACGSGISIDTVYRVAHSQIGVAVVRTREALGGCGCFAVARAPALALRLDHNQLEAIRFAERPPLNNCSHDQ